MLADLDEQLLTSFALLNQVFVVFGFWCAGLPALLDT